MAAPTQLDRIEAKLTTLILQGQLSLNYLSTIIQGESDMALSVAQLAAQINDATNAEAAALAAQAAAIDGVKAEVQSLFDRLQAAGQTPQDVLDTLAASVSRLGASSATLTDQTARLQALSVDPTNPVPVPAPVA